MNISIYTVYYFSRSDTHEYEYGLSTTNSTKTLGVTSKTEQATHAEKAVLMLNTYDSRNVPMVIGFNGKCRSCQIDPNLYDHTVHHLAEF